VPVGGIREPYIISKVSLLTRAWCKSYSIILALIPLISSQWKVSATRYNILFLLSAFGVHAYRDLWPLATYTQQPKDLADGGLVWAKVSVLAFTAIIIPLFIPRQYVPVDPKVWRYPALIWRSLMMCTYN